MTETKKWMTPFVKQLFVVMGVSINMASIGAITGFPAILLPQLTKPDSVIKVDTFYGSWIASIIGLSLIVGNLIVPSLMGKFGRKMASLISCSMLIICFIWIILATEVTSLLLARFFQGLAAGINMSLSPIMIGELTSPRNRGLFSAIMTTSVTCETLMVHIVGSYTTYQTTALVCACLSCVSFAILLLSPESPSWLADKGRYEESTKVYRWLRGETEDSELEKMLETRKTREVIVNSAAYGDSNKSVIRHIFKTLRRREFFKPVLIMIHLYSIVVWTGMTFLIVFTVDMIRSVMGITSASDIAMHITILDVQRLTSTILGIAFISKIKRRTVLFTSLGINIVVMLALAGYMFAKARFKLPFDHPAIGGILINLHMFSITTGALPLPVIISGELFPLEFRSVAGGISAIAFSLNFFITSKTALDLINAVGWYGAYLLYAIVTIYCSVVVYIYLPETKDRTLQDIEEEFKGKSDVETTERELGVSVPLNSEKNCNVDDKFA